MMGFTNWNKKKGSGDSDKDGGKKKKPLLQSRSSGFNNPKLSDTVVYDSEGNPYHCSKFLLGSKSGKFKELLGELGEKNEKEIRLENTKPEALEALLRYIHLGECNITEENFLMVMSIASEFNTTDLEEKCLTYETTDLNIEWDNCFMMLEKAMEFDRDELRDRCQRFVVRNLEHLTSRPEFLKMNPQLLKGLVACMVRLFHNRILSFSSVIEMVKGVSLWIDQSKENSKDAMEVLEKLPIGLCSQNEIMTLFSTGNVKNDPKLVEYLIEELTGSLSEPTAISWGALLKSFESESPDAVIPRGSSWKSWVVPETGWYYILAKGGKGHKAGTSVAKGVLDGIRGRNDQKNSEGGLGAVIGGAVFLHEGVKLKILAGKTISGGGSSCAFIKPQSADTKPVLLVAAGGGGGAGLSKSGSPAELAVGLESKDSSTCSGSGKGEKVPEFSGNSCGSMVREFHRPEDFSGHCTICDGGRGGNKGMSITRCGGGGGGFRGGHGELRLGQGGSSFITASAVNVVMFAGNKENAGVRIYKGREVPPGCFSE